MKKYSEITLTDEEKKIVEWFKRQGFTHIGRTTTYGFIECFDENNGARCNLKPMRKPFEFIENGERYEIEKLLNPPHEPNTVWDLENGDACWWINSSGFISKAGWDSTPVDIECRNQGNIFLTKEEAEFEKKRREVYEKVKKHARPFRQREENLSVFWNHVQSYLDMQKFTFTQGSQLYFESEEQIKQAIEEVGEDDFKKYYLGVTE